MIIVSCMKLLITKLDWKIFLINYKKIYKRNEYLVINNLINRSFIERYLIEYYIKIEFVSKRKIF